MAPPSKSKLHFASWYARLAAFNLEDLFSRKRPPGPPRTLYMNENLPQGYFDSKGKVKREHVYTTNQVITSKYNIITFLPRNLLEQFRRIANLFFLGIAILQIFPRFQTISIGGVILPLLIILLITALKDGYEDFRRHQSDKKVNHHKVFSLSGGNWSNRNVSERKSRSIIPDFSPRRKKSSTPLKGAIRPDLEFDYDASEQGINGPHWKETFWEDLRVGDFVKILDNEPIPADILICATSEDGGIAFVETKNLDGETNLKSRRAVQALTNLCNAQACANSGNSFQVQCDRPDTNMYRLNGSVTMNSQTSSVDLSMTLLRGTVLRNTKWAIGVVLFAGLDSKIILNSGGTPSKRSKVERQMNPQVIVNLTILAVMAIVCGIADSILERRFAPLGAPWLFLDNQSGDNPEINGLVTWAFALLTFQDIVPISLYISIEFVRTCQAAFIYFDYDIWYEKTDQATQARSWNLSDDLGQIEYIISDKTGTLTQNLMVFRKCTIAGTSYQGDVNPSHDDEEHAKSDALSIVEVPADQAADGDSATAPSDSGDGPYELETSRRNPPTATPQKFKDLALQLDITEATRSQNTASDSSKTLIGFFTVLSLCHSVLAAKDPVTGRVEYKAQSPDEAALVQAAADMGFEFLGKDKEILSLKTPGSEKVEEYELLHILEFTSVRKRMSVVVRRLTPQGGRILLLTKGADNIIFERLLPGADEMKKKTEKHLSEFANSGLRTLTLAYKTIPAEEYETWSERYLKATIAQDDREEQVEAVSSELEQGLYLLGATAIEDRLQDGVPETIEDLKRAGIKIWVATGDKLETAIAIGRSTNLINPDSNIIIVRRGSNPIRTQILNALGFFSEKSAMRPADLLSGNDPEEPIPLQRMNTGVSSIVGADNGNRVGGLVLVLEDSALLEAFADDEMKGLLLRLAILCEGVICCRVSPLQKALIVKLVKEGLGAMTLAIGDGANDVSMIQAADVGIGISGEEGMQAANSSDYSIAQFRFLKKLLLVHGHWSYARNGVMILNFFYKNIVPVGVLWWFQIFDAWSANYVFDYDYILFWNSLWTVAPVIGIGLFDRFLDAHVLMAVPELYRYGREGYWFGQKSFIIYMFDGIVQSAIIYFLIHFTYVSTTTRKDGYDAYLYEFSTTMALSAVLVANIFAGFNSTAWTAWLFFAVFIGILVQWLFTVIYSAIPPSISVINLWGENNFIFTSAYFWLSLPLTILLSLAPRFLSKAWKFSYNPGPLEIFQYLQKQYPNQDLSRFSISGKAPALSALQRKTSSDSRRSSRASSMASLEHRFTRASVDIRMRSRTDLSTGLVSTDRGFDFATEEHGVEMRRVQTNLSERRSNNQKLASQTAASRKGKDTISNVLSLPRGFLRRKQPSQDKAPE
ncbi:phospholipid-translocating P-type ATPase [Phlegmacium glaucopus]|nr:phospholipid-translocating P-type ATPase [Phlegmacium glaucopus]